jgi:hypothetical protein
MLEFKTAMPESSHKPSYGLSILLAIFIAAAGSACNRKAPSQSEADSGPHGEPDRYSARIVRSIDDGKTTVVSVSAFSRFGISTREDWTEGSLKRALICRPDLGKSFLLDLDRRLFAEIALGSQPGRVDAGIPAPASATKQLSPDDIGTSDSGSRDQRAIDPESLDLSFNEADDSSSVVQRTTGDEVVAGYRCRVEERRVVYSNGRSETTRWFRATELDGLALRIESETQSESRHVRVTTERTEISTDVSPDIFSVPSDFRKVTNLSQ